MNAPKAFQFPDELPPEVEGAEEELDIQIVDDTPPEDKGREPMPPEVVKELEDDDLGEYSEKVAKRLKQMKKVWHDERREKEAAKREAQEATTFAQTVVEENRGLKKRMGAGEKVFISEVTKAAESELITAREKLRAAIEGGDAEAIATQTEAVADAKARVRETSQLRPSLQEEEEGVKPTTQTQPAAAPVTVDPKAKAWQDSNTWFGDDEEMTALALGLHAKLVKSGTAASSDEYYDQINKTMRKRFPEYFKDENPEKPEKPEEPASRQQEKPAQTRRPATPVAPATRTTAPRQVRLTSSQVALAKRLGVSNEAYARQVLKLSSQEK
jgi:hypothetical protein